jgi:hypothetical protein
MKEAFTFANALNGTRIGHEESFSSIRGLQKVLIFCLKAERKPEENIIGKGNKLKHV